MQIKKSAVTSDELKSLIIKGMQEKKGNDIVVLNLKKIKNTFADYFVICSGTSDTQVSALSESVEEVVKKESLQNPWHREGNNNNEWVLLDYVDVVVHIFQQEKRDFYALENMWGDAELTAITART